MLGYQVFGNDVSVDPLAASGPTGLGLQGRLGCVLPWRLEENRTTLKGPL